MLEGLLTDGNKLKTTPAAARIPPPAQIALLSTLTIHPLYTSRAPERTHLHVATQSTAYLRGLLNVVGPISANLRAAFKFSGGDRSKGRGRTYNSSSDDDSDSDCIGLKYAAEQSIWRRAPDFWAILGWAFRCAFSYPHRWKYWRLWLEYMVDALESDWDERFKIDEEDHKRLELQRGSPMGDCEYPSLHQSLLALYLDDLHNDRKQPLREVMRALMAFTDVDSSADTPFFKEIFSNETTIGPRKNKRKRAQAVDLENDQFGDYFDRIDDDFGSEDEDEMAVDPPTAEPRKQTRRGGGQSSKQAPPFRLSTGVVESIPLRLRLFRLLSAATVTIPKKFAPVNDLYEKIADRIRGLPLPTFKLFVESHANLLPEEVYISLLRKIIEGLLPESGRGASKRPDPGHVDKEIDERNGISVLMLEKCFLPFASDRVTAEENAKLSLILEQMLWYLYNYAESNVECTEELRSAVEKGIKAREDKIRKKGAAAGKGDEKFAKAALERSARNLRVLLDVLRAVA